MDGCGRYKCFYLIVLPLARLGMMAAAIMAMMAVWNDFLIGFTLAVSEQKRLLAVRPLHVHLQRRRRLGTTDGGDSAGAGAE